MKLNYPAQIILLILVITGLVFSFPYLKRFIRTGTAAIIYEPPAIRENVMHIACVGDSITYGAGVADADGNRSEDVTWPYMLEERFNHEVQVLNYGVCGRTLMHNTGYSYTDTDYFRLSQECGANGYLILLGTNDSKAELWDAAAYEAELEEFAASYLNLPGTPDVVLVTPPCAFAEDGSETAAYGIRNDVIRDEICPIIKRTAGKLGIRCFDLYAESESHPEWFADGVHPNAEGNRAIAEFIHRSIMG